MLAESALAIMQKRAVYVEDLKPGFLAKRLNWLFAMHSSLSSVYSVEAALKEIGTFRFLLATFLGILGKIIHRSGDFYRFAGRTVATIDDCSGTMPPYDKFVVLGPKNSWEIVKEIKAKTALEAAVVDANDLGKVDVLAASSPKIIALLQKALASNPQGNANEQTPLVLIKPDEITL